jgi:hypothetical protein
VYYLDRDYILQEYCYFEGRGWYSGSIGSMNINVAHKTRLAAIYYGPECHIRIYLQGDFWALSTLTETFPQVLIRTAEAGSLNVTELCYDNGYWYRGQILAPGLEGTSIAAVAYPMDEDIQIRVYFQRGDLSLMEYCHNHHQGWYQGWLHYCQKRGLAH